MSSVVLCVVEFVSKKTEGSVWEVGAPETGASDCRTIFQWGRQVQQSYTYAVKADEHLPLVGKYEWIIFSHDWNE